MKKLLFLTLIIAFSAALNASEKDNKKALLGKWNYQVPSAPYEYQKGILVFTEKEGELAGEVLLPNGSKSELTKITFEDGLLKCTVYVEYNYIGIEAKVEGHKMSGTVDSPDGKIDLKAEKAE